MPSFIWNRDAQEAIRNPYEYDAQKQFHREAINLTSKLGKLLCEDFEYTLENRTLEKAIWMLQTDCLFAFRDAVILLEQEKHRIVGRLFRDILETVHLIEFLESGTEKAEKALADWFEDELIMHREFRNYIKAKEGKETSDLMRDYHRIFSKFTHRSYKVLLYGYMLGAENRIFYDEEWTLQQSISMYYAYLGQFGQLILENLKKFGNLSKETIGEIWEESMEKEQIPRRFIDIEELKAKLKKDNSA